MQDPPLVTICYRREKLQHQRLDLGLQERGWHDSEQSFEVVLNEVHDNEHPLTNAMLREVLEK